MVLNGIDMNMQALDKKITACILLLLLELFVDGKWSNPWSNGTNENHSQFDGLTHRRQTLMVST